MFNVSNYYQQSKELPAQDDFQLLLLKGADAAIFLRETSKVGAVIGLVSSVSSVVFNFDPKILLTCTAICGISWFLTGACAKKLEPEAQEMIRHFQAVKEGKFSSEFISYKQAD